MSQLFIFIYRRADEQGPDPLLTPYGREQVAKTADAWKEQIKANVPLPQVLYSSPLRRAIDTVEITWNDISLSAGCDKRVCRLSCVTTSQSLDFS